MPGTIGFCRSSLGLSCSRLLRPSGEAATRWRANYADRSQLTRASLRANAFERLRPQSRRESLDGGLQESSETALVPCQPLKRKAADFCLYVQSHPSLILPTVSAPARSHIVHSFFVSEEELTAAFAAQHRTEHQPAARSAQISPRLALPSKHDHASAPTAFSGRLMFDSDCVLTASRRSDHGGVDGVELEPGIAAARR
jgi:hypothetical protein